MSDTISIDHAGRLVLPKEIRDRFRIRGGSRLEISVVGDHVELAPLRNDDEAEMTEDEGFLVLSGKGQPFSAAEALRADRDERDKHLTS